MQSTKSIQALLDWLKMSGQLHKSRQAEAFILSQSNLTSPSLTIQALLGIGALLGCFFIIGFLHLANIINFNNTTSLISAGLFFIILALCLYAIAKQSNILTRLFLIQSAFALLIVGKALFIGGFFKLCLEIVPWSSWEAHHINPGWMISVGLLLTTIVTYFLFPLMLERALSCFALLCSLMVNAIFSNHYNDILTFVYYLFLLSTTIFLFTWKNKAATWSALTYACALALLLMGGYLATVDNSLNVQYFLLFSMNAEKLVPLWAFNLTTALGLIVLCYQLVSNNQSDFMTLPLMLACLAILLLAFISSAGILIAIAFLVLSYANHDRILTFLGIISLGWFLIWFYYNLPVSFVQRSQILAFSGIVLLGVRFLMKHQKWDRN